MSTTTTTRPVTAADLIGQPVIIMGQEGTYEYEGDDRYGFESIAFRAGRTNGVATSFNRVAPADTPIPTADPRITVEKRPLAEARRAGHYGRGSWRLTLPDRPDVWANTKAEAVAKGLRRLAIMDWHAANAQDVTE